MRSKTVILLVLALGCGLVASIGISQVLQRNQDQGPAEETAPVWIAMADIKSGDALSAQNLKIEQWPKEKIPPGALGKLEQIDGKHTRATIYQGEPVLEKKLRVSGTSAADTIPTGFRLYTVQGDSLNSHGGLLHPGDRVDVLVYIDKSLGTIEAGTKTILQDIKVFAVNDQLTPPDEKSAESITAKTVTLLTTPGQAEKATLAAGIGHISLVVRSPDDKSDVNPAGTKLSDIFTTEKTNRDEENMDKPPGSKSKVSGLAAVLNQIQQAAVQNPAPPQSVVDDQRFSVQIIKGTEITETEFTHKLNNSDRWEHGSIGTAPSSEPANDSAAPPSKDQPKKDGKDQGPAGKKDGPKSSEKKNNDASSSASHA